MRAYLKAADEQVAAERIRFLNFDPQIIPPWKLYKYYLLFLTTIKEEMTLVLRGESSC